MINAELYEDDYYHPDFPSMDAMMNLQIFISNAVNIKYREIQKLPKNLKKFYKES